MITKENHEAIELLVASINQIQAKAKDAGLLALCGITFYSSSEADVRLQVYPDEGPERENITEAKLNITSYDTMAADLSRISVAIERYQRINTRKGTLEQRRKELIAELEGVESELKLIRDGKAAE